MHTEEKYVNINKRLWNQLAHAVHHLLLTNQATSECYCYNSILNYLCESCMYEYLRNITVNHTLFSISIFPQNRSICQEKLVANVFLTLSYLFNWRKMPSFYQVKILACPDIWKLSGVTPWKVLKFWKFNSAITVV